MTITFTSDFGLRDYYVAAMKGALLQKLSPQACTFVDVSHEVEPHDLVGAAYLLRNVWREFPEGTLHLVSVLCYYQKQPNFLLAKHEGHYFLAPDNGFLSLLFDGVPVEAAYLLQWPENGDRSLRSLYAQAASWLAQGKPLSELGTLTTALTQRISLQPVSGPNWIRGVVVHIDRYDNVITNIPRDLFERVGQGLPFSLFFKRHDPIQRLSQSYADVPLGETLCRFNASGLLEIAVHLGHAATLHGLAEDDGVQVEFREAE